MYSWEEELTYCDVQYFLHRSQVFHNHLGSVSTNRFKHKLSKYCSILWIQLTAVTLNVSTQFVESSVAVGPAVVNVSKSNLKVQMSENMFLVKFMDVRTKMKA